METEKKKNNSLVIILLLLLFIIFIVLYISKETGYYEYKAYEKVLLTEESIKKFENDLEEGKDVNAKDYIVIDNTNYSNKVSNAGASIGEFIEEIMNKSLKKTVKVLRKLFYE